MAVAVVMVPVVEVATPIHRMPITARLHARTVEHMVRLTGLTMSLLPVVPPALQSL